MVAVAQLVESRIVIPVVVGSSPISHPTAFLRVPGACVLADLSQILTLPFATVFRMPRLAHMPLISVVAYRFRSTVGGGSGERGAKTAGSSDREALERTRTPY